MASISTAPTPFDQVSKEMLNDWLGHPVTQALVAGIQQNIGELEERTFTMVQPESANDPNLGAWFRSMLQWRAALVTLLEWIKGASRG